MTSIYKTAYPYYSDKKKMDDEIILKDYALTREEITAIRKDMPDDASQLNYAVLLVVFRNLNYFPETNIIPTEIIKYIKEQLQITNAQFNSCHPSTITRHKKRIYNYLRITSWKTNKQTNNDEVIYPVKAFAEKTATEASKLHNYPADIINIVVEALKQKNFELPTFKQLDRIVRHARETINQQLFDDVFKTLSGKQIETLDQLLETTDEYQRSKYNELKTLPKNPTITHFKELLKHHDWLMSFDDTNRHLKNIIPIKLGQFAEQARTLDASDLKDFSKSKRYTLMLCLIHHLQCCAKDSLVITFYKTMFGMHKKSRTKLEDLREYSRIRTQELLGVFSDILSVIGNTGRSKILKKIHSTLDEEGGAKKLKMDCDQAIALNSNNYFPFLLDFFRGKRGALLKLLETLDLRSSNQDTVLVKAINFILDKKDEKSEYISDHIDLSFTADTWRKLIVKTENKDGVKELFHHRYLEICILSHVASELRTKDLYVVGADSYDDHRKELLPWETCENLLDDYCNTINIANNGKKFVDQLKERLESKAKAVDDAYPTIDELTIDKSGNPILHKRNVMKKTKIAMWLDKTIKLRLKERNLIDILCSSHFYCHWAEELGPISGDDPKIKNAIGRYILTCFAYATRLGPTQTAQHVRDSVSAHMLSWINRRHVTPEMLDRAREKLINLLKQFKLTKSWGDGTSASGDGTMQELREQSLIAEFHFRYRKKGGVSYHHVADNYILLFSTFMSCGVWEAVEIIEGLLKNNSDLQPDIIHGDTQAQSTVVFALAYLLGFRLMPRIRNWKDLKLFRSSKKTTYKNIDMLFKDTIDWDLIEKHWNDMMQVVLSIKKGKMSSSKLLRKLSSYSKKNRLYQAFQELGYVIRTLFLLDYISDVKLRETINERTNKVESYNAFSDFCSFGNEVLVASNDEKEMEKAVKYGDILTNAVMLQNVSDMTEIIALLKDEGHVITKEDMSHLCPYLTAHLKRFGDIVMNFDDIPKSVEASRRKVLW